MVFLIIAVIHNCENLIGVTLFEFTFIRGAISFSDEQTPTRISFPTSPNITDAQL